MTDNFENIRDALNQYTWDWFIQNDCHKSAHLNPFCALILIQMYLNGQIQFSDSIRESCCHALSDFGLVYLFDRHKSVYTYSLTPLGRKYVTTYLPHYKLIYYIGMISMTLREIMYAGFFIFNTIILVKSSGSHFTYITGIVMLLWFATAYCLLYIIFFTLYPFSCSVGLHHTTKNDFEDLFRSSPKADYLDPMLSTQNLVTDLNYILFPSKRKLRQFKLNIVKTVAKGVWHSILIFD